MTGGAERKRAAHLKKKTDAEKRFRETLPAALRTWLAKMPAGWPLFVSTRAALVALEQRLLRAGAVVRAGGRSWLARLAGSRPWWEQHMDISDDISDDNSDNSSSSSKPGTRGRGARTARGRARLAAHGGGAACPICPALCTLLAPALQCPLCLCWL